MAVVGTIEQYQGPFSSNYSLSLNGNCIIGISIGEDDFMKLGSNFVRTSDIEIEQNKTYYKYNNIKNWYEAVAYPTVQDINSYYEQRDKSFRFTVNGEQIWMGRTYMYQTDKPIIGEQQFANDTVITFPDGAPSSVLVEVVYCAATASS